MDPDSIFSIVSNQQLHFKAIRAYSGHILEFKCIVRCKRTYLYLLFPINLLKTTFREKRAHLSVILRWVVSDKGTLIVGPVSVCGKSNILTSYS